MGKSGEIMLFGTYYHNLDDKGRLLLPSKLLTKLTPALYLLKGFDGCVSIYLEDTFSQYIEQLSKKSYLEKESRDVLRIALSSTVELNIDSSNRIQLPIDVLRKYQINKKVVVLGVIDHLEIWDENKWKEYQLQKEDQFENIVDTIAKN